MPGETVSLKRIREQMESLWVQECDALVALHATGLKDETRGSLIRLLTRVRADRAKLSKALCEAEMAGAEQIHWTELIHK